MTATHSVVAEPVAARLGFQHWLGSAVGVVDGCYTGKPEGQPCFQSGKVAHLAAWRSRQTNSSGNEDTWFYSDSHNDLPLLSEVGHPVAVDPDPVLAEHAERLAGQCSRCALSTPALLVLCCCGRRVAPGISNASSWDGSLGCKR
jgi:phosphoserine phosphatase